MAILPMGTANNIAKSLGGLGVVDELIAGWRGAERQRLRVGSVTSRRGTMRFVESAGVGLFTELVTRGQEEVEDNAAGLRGTRSTAGSCCSAASPRSTRRATAG